MLLKIKDQESYERAVQILKLAGIEVEDIETVPADLEIKETVVYIDHIYHFECPYCGYWENLEAKDFEKMYDKETGETTCRCGKVSKAGFVDGEIVNF